jgi:hypothetical protein
MNNRKKLPAVSAYNVDSHWSGQPKIPVDDLFSFGSLMRKVDESTRDSYYDDEGMEEDDQPRLFVDDIDWTNLECHEASTKLERVLDLPFEVQEASNLTPEGFVALNSHFVTGLSIAEKTLPPDFRTLIICAGNGEDLARLTHGGVARSKQIDMVGATSPHARARWVKGIFKDRIRSTSRYLHDLPPGWLADSYDLILCHHGLHHVVSTPLGEAAFKSVLQRLTPNGVFIGDKIDLMGLDSMVKYTTLPSHGVELLHLELDDRTSEGTMTVRVGSKNWKDPVLSDRRMFSLPPEGFVLHALPGLGAYTGTTLLGTPFVPPKTVAGATKRSEGRVVTYIEIRRSGSLSQPSPLGPGAPPPPRSVAWTRVDKFPGHALQLFNFPLDKGVHLQAQDLRFVSPDYSLFSVKSDGVSARVVVNEGCAYLMTIEVPPRMMMANGFTRTGQPILRLQCELLPNGVVELCEPIHLGPQTPRNFKGRLDYFSQIAGASTWIPQLVTVKEWSYDGIKMMKRVLELGLEGVVIMNPGAPSPMDGPQFWGLANYVKVRPTIDVMTPGGVEEQYLDGTIKRLRPDKKHGNSSYNIQSVRDSVPYHALMDFLSMPHSPEDEADLLSTVRDLPYPANHPGMTSIIRYPMRKHPDPLIQSRRAALLEELDCVLPEAKVKYQRREMEILPSITEAEYDIGMLGSGNSKGDGPYHQYCLSEAVMQLVQFLDGPFPPRSQLLGTKCERLRARTASGGKMLKLKGGDLEHLIGLFGRGALRWKSIVRVHFGPAPMEVYYLFPPDRPIEGRGFLFHILGHDRCTFCGHRVLDGKVDCTDCDYASALISLGVSN